MTLKKKRTSLCCCNVPLEVSDPVAAVFTSQIKQKRPTVGKKSKKGAGWKFTLDLTHPVEDGILDSANFVSINWS